MDTPTNGTDITQSRISGRSAGLSLGAGTLLAVLFMAMHPTGRGHAGAGMLAHLMMDRNAIVHAALTALMLPVLLGFIGLADTLGLRRLWVLAGLVLYCVGVLAGAAAALVNGFVVPGVAAAYIDSGDAGAEIARPSLVLCHAINSTCAKVDVIGASLAAIIWGAPLARRPGAARVCGALGVVCGLIPLVALAIGRLPMNFHGFGAFVLLQGVWGLAAATVLVRGRI